MKRRSYIFALLAMVSATAVAIFIWANRSVAPVPPVSLPVSIKEAPPEIALAKPTVAEPAPPTQVGSAGKVPGPEPRLENVVPHRPPPPGAPLRIPSGQPIPQMLPFEKERVAIQTLASTYDAKRIPELAAYLEHPDAMVRDEARLGLIQLSSPEAVPVLRAAAAKAKTAEEATALREAADFLGQLTPGQT